MTLIALSIRPDRIAGRLRGDGSLLVTFQTDEELGINASREPARICRHGRPQLAVVAGDLRKAEVVTRYFAIVL